MNSFQSFIRFRPLFLALVVCAGSLTRAQVVYTVTDLGANLVPFGINNSGQIVGQDPNVDQGQAFLLSNGTLTHLGNFSVQNQNHSSTARAINDSGVITGGADYYVVTNPPFPFGARTHAFSYNGSLSDLSNPGLPTSGLTSEGFSINSSGVIAGASNWINGGSTHAVVYSGGTVTDLGTIGGTGTSSSATGINNSGVVVGYSTSGSFANNHAFIYTNGVMQDLGTLPNETTSAAYAINNSGVIAGVSGSNFFRYANGVMTDLGNFGSNPRVSAINSSGQIVGSANVAINNTHAFSYTTGGTFIDLNSEIAANSGWLLQSAWSVNDTGQIVGTGDFNGVQHGFLLTPTAIPEPSTYSALLGLAVLGFTARSRRTRAG